MYFVFTNNNSIQTSFWVKGWVVGLELKILFHLTIETILDSVIKTIYENKKNQISTKKKLNHIL